MDPPDNALTPDRLFERQWAMTVLERSMSSLREESVRSGDTSRFDLLKVYLTGEEPAVPYRQVAAELGISESAVGVAVHRMRQRFGQVLREVIAQTVTNPAEIDDEIRSCCRRSRSLGRVATGTLPPRLPPVVFRGRRFSYPWEVIYEAPRNIGANPRGEAGALPS